MLLIIRAHVVMWVLLLVCCHRGSWAAIIVGMGPLPINGALFILKVEVQVRVSHILGDKGKTRFFQIFTDSKSRVIERRN
ncbi:hypothetical protein V8C40DRAFT_176963 [Trichoderma camerunense]